MDNLSYASASSLQKRKLKFILEIRKGKKNVFAKYLHSPPTLYTNEQRFHVY